VKGIPVLALWRKPAPPVLGILTAPPEPTWWKANRHKVLLVAGLIAGFWLATHLRAAAHPHCPAGPASSPATTAPTTTAPTPAVPARTATAPAGRTRAPHQGAPTP
jgi:hypothetical protein